MAHELNIAQRDVEHDRRTLSFWSELYLTKPRLPKT
jgi:hypothetical protein